MKCCVWQEINNLWWANLIQTFILGLLYLEITTKETKTYYLEKSNLWLCMFTKQKECLESFFCKRKASEEDFAGESWIHSPLGTENIWIWSHLFFLLPDICARLKNATLTGIVQKTNVVINFSKDSNGEAEAQAMQWFIMWCCGVLGASQKVISGDVVWWEQWEVDSREQLDCRNMFSNLLAQVAALPIPDVHKSQEKPEKGLRLVKNLKLRF